MYFFQAILSKDTDDDQRWLKYWIIIAVFMIVQIPCDWILGWAPGFNLGYYTIFSKILIIFIVFAVKIAFLLWCMAPLQENGSVMLFKLVRFYLMTEIGFMIILLLSGGAALL